MYQRRNESPDFVGLEALKKRHKEQLTRFESWAAQRDWNSFHMSHYDWWMFPYGCHSGAFGASYAIYECCHGDGTCTASVRSRTPILTSADRIGRSAYINVPSP